MGRSTQGTVMSPQRDTLQTSGAQQVHIDKSQATANQMMGVEKPKKLVVAHRCGVGQGVEQGQDLVAWLEMAARQFADHPRMGRHLTLLQEE
jgi:hypothetical protein